MTDLAFNGENLVRPRHRLLRLLVCLVVVSGLLLWAFLAFVSGLGKSLNGLGAGLGRAITGGGADEAAQVSNIASAEGVTPGYVSIAYIQRQLPSEHWLPGNVAATTGKSQVSLAATDNHVTTATAEIGACFYGLSVGSTSDPIVAADSLPGPGVYWASSLTSDSSSCTADQAPTTGWAKLSKNDLFDAGVKLDPAS